MKKALAHLEKSDTVLASIIARVGPYRMAYREPKFEALARSIVFQQLSTKAASTIYGRVAEACGGAITPEAIRNLTVGSHSEPDCRRDAPCRALQTKDRKRVG